MNKMKFNLNSQSVIKVLIHKMMKNGKLLNLQNKVLMSFNKDYKKIIFLIK